LPLLQQEGDKEGPAPERFGPDELARRVRPTPPAATLAVEGRELNEEVRLAWMVIIVFFAFFVPMPQPPFCCNWSEKISDSLYVQVPNSPLRQPFPFFPLVVIIHQVDVQINQVWTEGCVSKVDKDKLTVSFPGGAGGGKESSTLIVFGDTSGQVWAREVWNKKGAKHAALRKGWTFSPGGQWLVRGQVVGRTTHTRARATVAKPGDCACVNVRVCVWVKLFPHSSFCFSFAAC
jgi:hypothetical protein